MKYLLLLLGISICLLAENNEKIDSVQDIMVISKMTGICGTMQQMAQFQKVTKMAGGDEFISRYWHTEMARLGLTEQAFLKQCEIAISLYSVYWDEFERMKKDK